MTRTDQDGEALTYSWVEVDGTAVTLSGSDTATPGFTAPEVGVDGDTLTFEVTVSDGIDTTTDTVVVDVSNVNQLPVADAGSDVTADELTLVTLDGTASSDPDGDALTYSWSQVPGTPVPLSTSVLLRSERQGGGNGRVYEVSFLADDGLGGTCTGTFELATPHDRRHPAVDDGQLHDSTGGS